MNENYIKNVVEAALLAAGRPLPLNELVQLFDENARPDPAALRAALESLEADYGSRGIEVKETATGFRIQVRREMANEVSRLWPERPPKYSRALLETLALIAYRQPITRAEIEAVRGVAVNPNIIKTVLERNWVKVVGTRDVPGRPELLGTTREFLDYFGLKSLEDLPTLAELKAMGEINLQLDLAKPEVADAGETVAANDSQAATPSEAVGFSGEAVGAPSEPIALAPSDSDGLDVAAPSELISAPGEPISAAENAAHPVANTDAFLAAAAASDADASANAEAATPTESISAPERREPPVLTLVDTTSHESDLAPLPAEDPVPTDAITAEVNFTVEHDIAADTLTHIEIESDPGDVTVEVQALSLIESRIEASIESDEPAAADPVATATTHDASIETGEFELSELGMSRAPGTVIEAEFDAGDLDANAADDDASDDDEERSASPKAKSGLVAARRDRDD